MPSALGLVLYDLVSYCHNEAPETQKSHVHWFFQQFDFGTFFFDSNDILSYVSIHFLYSDKNSACIWKCCPMWLFQSAVTFPLHWSQKRSPAYCASDNKYLVACFKFQKRVASYHTGTISSLLYKSFTCDCVYRILSLNVPSWSSYYFI